MRERTNIADAGYVLSFRAESSNLVDRIGDEGDDFYRDQPNAAISTSAQPTTFQCHRHHGP